MYIAKSIKCGMLQIVQRMRERILDPGTLVRGCEELANIVGSVRAQVQTTEEHINTRLTI